MRVVAGTARGRLLRVPPGKGTRPTSDRVREAMFNILTSMDAVEGAAVFDLFAGSGALGVEALSRGAGSATFVESDTGAVEVIRANLAVLGEDARRADVVRADVLGWARRWVTARRGPVSPPVLMVVDPPYAWGEWEELLAVVRTAAGLLVAETGIPLEPGPSWETVRSRRYGSTVVTVMRPSAHDQTEGPGQLSGPAHSRGGI